MALVLRCGGCGCPAGPSLAVYPSASGVPLCRHCAYSRGELSGREKRKYIRRHPLRATADAFKRLRAWWRRPGG